MKPGRKLLLLATAPAMVVAGLPSTAAGAGPSKKAVSAANTAGAGTASNSSGVAYRATG